MSLIRNRKHTQFQTKILTRPVCNIQHRLQRHPYIHESVQRLHTKRCLTVPWNFPGTPTGRISSAVLVWSPNSLTPYPASTSPKKTRRYSHATAHIDYSRKKLSTCRTKNSCKCYSKFRVRIDSLIGRRVLLLTQYRIPLFGSFVKIVLCTFVVCPSVTDLILPRASTVAHFLLVDERRIKFPYNPWPVAMLVST